MENLEIKPETWEMGVGCTIVEENNQEIEMEVASVNTGRIK